MKKRLAITFAVIAFLYIGLSFLGGVLVMRIPRLPLVNSPAAVGLNYENVSFPARSDSIILKGWYIFSRGEAVILVVHGGFQNRVDDNVDTLNLARELALRGYDLLLFDLRGRGESQGTGHSLSNIVPDIGGAVDYLKSKGYSIDSIGIIGFCSGAASVAIYAGGESIGALVLDGCFTTVHDMVERQATSRGIPKLLVDLFIPGLTLSTRLMYGFVPIDPLNIIPDITSPILFIHEGDDDLISQEDTLRLFVVSRNPANEIWEIDTVEHSQAYRSYPVQFVEMVVCFFNKSLIRRIQ